MVCLRAIEIHGLRARNGHVEGADHAAGAAVEGDEAAIHAFARRGGLAWRGHIALRDGVVPSGELELNYVAGLGRHGVGGKSERVAADEHRD